MVRFKLHTVIVYVKLRKAAAEDGFSDPKGLVKVAREKLLGYVLILNRSCFAGFVSMHLKCSCMFLYRMPHAVVGA